MSAQISPVGTTRAGLCPHGLPPSACPICNGKGMAGGGTKAKETPVMTKPSHSGQWSYMKCVAVGMQMASAKAAEQNAKASYERQLEYFKELGKTIDKIADKIKENIQNLQNSLPNTLRVPIQTIVNFVINPVLNLIAQIPKIMEKITTLQKDAREFVQQVAEKLVTVLGEIKNFMDRKVADKIKKKVKSIFSFFISEFWGENFKGDDALEVFKSRELKKYLLKILKSNKKRDDDVNRRIESKTV